MREQSGLQIPDPDDDVTGLKKNAPDSRGVDQPVSCELCVYTWSPEVALWEPSVTKATVRAFSKSTPPYSGG